MRADGSHEAEKMVPSERAGKFGPILSAVIKLAERH